tara:strand:+ start:407 stop:1111 length:705 start_codon:yes stop_codon:yes gene_type:complete
MKLKSIISKYSIEFFVILFSISVSFYLEKRRALTYKEKLKNESLSKIKQNILFADEDFRYNISIHKDAIESINSLYFRSDSLFNNRMNDSLGYYLHVATNYTTILVDNDEEYETIKNSGLIELIENKKVIELLQNKYSNHKFIKSIEEIILRDMIPEFKDFLSRHTKYDFNKPKHFGIWEGKNYSSKNRIPDYILEKLMDKSQFHKQYVMVVNNQLKRDSIIIEEINKEISFDN